MGPFELLDLIGLDVNLDDRPLLLRPGRRAGALAPEPDPGDAWSPKASSAARAASGYYAYGEGTRARARPRRCGIDGADPRPRAAGEDRPRRRPTILPRLFAQIANEAAFARKRRSPRPRTWRRRCGSASTGRCGPLGDHRADRPRAARSSCSTSSRPSTARPTAPAPRLRAEAEAAAMSSEPQAGLRAHRAAQPRGRRRAAARRPTRTSPTPSRGLVARFEPARSRASAAGSSGTSSSYDFLAGEPPGHRPPQPLAPEPAEPDRRPLRGRARASTRCAASTSRTCTLSRASGGSSSSTR